MTTKSLEQIAQEAAREWYSRVSLRISPDRMDELSAFILTACEKAKEQFIANLSGEPAGARELITPQPQRSEPVETVFTHGTDAEAKIPRLKEHPPATEQECANIHIEHYFPKGYDPKAEPWKSIKAHHNAALAAERGKVRILTSALGLTHDKLAAAQAAIAEHNANYEPRWCSEIKADLSALEKHDEELKAEIDLWKRQAAFESEHREKYRNRIKPLVDALEMLRESARRHGRESIIDDALARHGGSTTAYPLPDGRTK